MYQCAQCEWWWADWGMLMFPLWLLWGTRWLDLQPPGWSPSLHGLPLWFTLTSTGRSDRSHRGHGETVNGVCAGLQHTETLLQDPRRGRRDGRGRKAPWSLGRTSGRITERLKCFLCGWKKPKKCSQPNPLCSKGAVRQGDSSYILKTSSFSWASSLSLLSIYPTFTLLRAIFYCCKIKPRFSLEYNWITLFPTVKEYLFEFWWEELNGQYENGKTFWW